MGFGEAISAGFSNYFNFSGRAARSAYWYFVLFLFIMGLVTAVLDLILFGTETIGPLNGIFGLATIVPHFAVLVRRLHDIGRSGWWVLLSLIPIIGWIVLIYWACQPSMPQQNEYGPAPA
jgi:uncharacterized membrane protein YhaH (DUF805 family)